MRRTRTTMAAALAAVAALAATVAAFELEQVGCFPPGTLRGDVRLSGDGRTLVFSAAAELVPGANPLGIPQLFALDLETRAVRQLTPARPDDGGDVDTCRAVDASVSHDARRVVALGVCGLGPERMRWRLLDHRDGTTAALGRWTRCAPVLLPQALSGDGRRLAVGAACDPARSRARRRPARQRLWLQGRPGGRLRAAGPHGRCESLAPALDHDGGRLAFLSDCDPVGENPTRAMNLFTRERPSGRLRQRTRAVHVDAGGRCGTIQYVGPFRSGLFEAPALAPGGPALLAASCVDERDPGEVLLHRLWAFPAAGGEPGELPLPACSAEPSLRTVTSPVAASRGAERIALVRACAPVGDVRRGEQALIVLRHDGPPVTLLENAGVRVLVDREIRRPALDAAGSVVATITAEPPPGCAGAGDPQLVLARDLGDPVLRRVTCGCGAG